MAAPLDNVRPFSDRIRARQRFWWGKPGKWRNRESYRRLLHRVKETHRLLSKDDPDSRWRCCDLWQRTLSNKWNAREFAQRHGCRVPTLYWWGRRPAALPLDSLPAHFVIRPIWGANGRGVHVLANGRDLLHERTYSRDELRTELRREQGRLSRFPLLVEEFVKTENSDYALPVEYKCYTFGGTVAAIQVVERFGIRARHGFYNPAWELLADRMNTHNPPAPYRDPPHCLEEILVCAKRLGVAYGTFVRVDFYATDRGCVFGELSSTPLDGREFTAFAEEHFGRLWQATFPDRT